MATFLMFPSINVAQQTVVANGRSYSGSPGSAQNVPDMDAATLAANGWTKLMLTGPTTARPSSNPTVTPGFTAARGMHFYDATLSELVTFDGATWRTVAGVSA